MLLGYSLNKEQKKIIYLSSLGGMLEFYDFTIYALFAAYFSQQFFPTHDALISLIASYSIFVVGYVVRPLGGILFSHIGDEIGRKTVLILTMALMGIASLGMGLLPTYAQIGVYAPILMLLFRLIQGLAIGGELPSMIVYASESMPDKRAYAIGGVFSGTVAGLIPGMLINRVMVEYLSKEQLLSFGWRIPFIIGGLLCIIAYFVRKELHETIDFEKIKKRSAQPFFEVLSKHFKEVLIGTGLIAIVATPIVLLILFMPTYLTKLVNMDARLASDAVLFVSIISFFSIYITGILASKYDIKKLTLSSLVAILFAATICYYTISTKSNLIFVGMALFAVFQGALVTLPIIMISHLFPTTVRLTGIALSYNISFVLFGGVAPIVVTSLIAQTGLVYVIPVVVLAVAVIYAYWAVSKVTRYEVN